MSAGNPESDLIVQPEPFSAPKNDNFTQVTPTTAYENGWTPIREDEFERLPDWCIDIYRDRMKGVLPAATNDDVTAALHHYLSEPKWADKAVAECDAKVEPIVVEPVNETSKSEAADMSMSDDHE